MREGTTVDASTERSPADVVVGADGANGTTARAFGLGAGIVHGVAYEGNVPYGVVSRERYGAGRVVELGDVPGGYGWVFPKGDHVNVGVGALAERRAAAARAPAARLRRARARARSSSRALRGHRLPLRRPGDADRRRARARSSATRPG